MQLQFLIVYVTMWVCTATHTVDYSPINKTRVIKREGLLTANSSVICAYPIEKAMAAEKKCLAHMLTSPSS